MLVGPCLENCVQKYDLLYLGFAYTVAIHQNGVRHDFVNMVYYSGLFFLVLHTLYWLGICCIGITYCCKVTVVDLLW